MEQIQEMIPVQVNYLCDNCNSSHIELQSQVTTGLGPKFVHICPNCDAEYVMDTMYPYVRFDCKGNS